MANIESAKKRMRQNVKRRALNRWRMRAMRQAMKSFQKELAAGNVEGASEAARVAARVIDKTAQKGVIHRNQAARRKSRMSKHLLKLKNGS